MWRKAIIAAGLLVTVASEAPSAAAQPTPYSTLDRHGLATRFGIDAAIGLHSQSIGPIDVNRKTFHLDFHGQLMTPRGLGAYFEFPINFMSVDDERAPNANNDDFAIGNLELGGVYALRMSGYALIGRIGFALPTAENSPSGFNANFNAQTVRATDLTLALPKTGSLRFSVSALLGAHSQFFGRVDLGADVPVTEPNNIDFDPYFRLNVGGGYKFSSWMLMGELTNTFLTNAGNALSFPGGPVPSNDLSFHLLGFTARFLTNRKWQPSAGLVLPLSSDVRHQGLDVGFVFGIQHVGPF